MPDNTRPPINENRISAVGKVFNVDIVPEMERSYLDYAMSVIVARALPDVRDGLKPVHRRIIYAMEKMGLTAHGKNVKSAAVVGEVLKSYHPHGDAAVYMSLVRMAQTFSLRYPLVFGQGNFGSIDGDPPAAMRYTEIRMSKLTPEMIADIDKETVNMVPNYDATTTEPSVLPTRIPNLLLNGADGIAVGMATRIPPHNLTELCQAIDLILHHSRLELVPDLEIKNLVPKTQNTLDLVLQPVYQLQQQKYLLETSASVDDLLKFVQGPDFPTGGEIFGKQGINEMYQTGRGKFTIRGIAKIEETKSGKIRIVITELPYQVNKAEFVKKIADLVTEKKIIGISDLRDESDRHGIRIVAEIRKIGKPKSILNKLYKYTALQSSYSAIMLSLVNGVPQTLNLRQMLLLFVRHRENIIRRRTFFELKAAYLRHHILQGFKKALDLIDEVIKTIRSTKVDEDPKSKLMQKFDFTDLQAQAILDMQLRRLSGLERQKIDDEYNLVSDNIKKLTSIITQSATMIKTLVDDNREIIQKYQDDRLTKIHVRNLQELSEADLIPNEPTLVTITKTGYIKRVPKETYRSQNRGGVGVSGMTTKAEDEVENILSVNTHDDVLFFTNRGRCFKTKVWDIPESNRQSKGQAVVNLIDITQGETIQAILPISKDSNAKFIILATKRGVTKKTSIERFQNIRQNGLAAIKLDEGDQLCWAKAITDDNHVFLVTHKGKCIRFAQSDTRPMGRHTRGVRGIFLKDGDYLVSMDVLPADPPKGPKGKDKPFQHLFMVTENGIGKRSDVYLYPIQKRGGVGVKVANLSTKTGNVAAASVVTSQDDQIILVTKKAVTLRLPLKNIPVLSRNTKGVILMRFKSTDDKVNAITLIKKTDKPTEKPAVSSIKK